MSDALSQNDQISKMLRHGLQIEPRIDLWMSSLCQERIESDPSIPRFYIRMRGSCDSGAISANDQDQTTAKERP